MHHGIRIRDAALESAVRLSQRYIPDRQLPDKAIDLVDEAASRVRMQIDSTPEVIDQLERRVAGLEVARQALMNEDDAERLDAVVVELDALKLDLDQRRAAFDAERGLLQRVRLLTEQLEQARAAADEAMSALIASSAAARACSNCSVNSRTRCNKPRSASNAARR